MAGLVGGGVGDAVAVELLETLSLAGEPSFLILLQSVLDMGMNLPACGDHPSSGRWAGEDGGLIYAGDIHTCTKECASMWNYCTRFLGSCQGGFGAGFSGWPGIFRIVGEGSIAVRGIIFHCLKRDLQDFWGFSGWEGRREQMRVRAGV